MSALSGELARLLESTDWDLARAALIVAKVEYPALCADTAIATLDRLGAQAGERLAALAGQPLPARVAELNRFLYTDEGFSGNRTQYHDFRNSLLNVVLERRTGIPITLALVYREVARRAGLQVFGVSFPGHFLLRVPPGAGDDPSPGLILDPFEHGRLLDQDACRLLMIGQVGSDEDFSADLLRPCSTRQFLARILNNLKRAYIEQRSFPQAHAITELLLTVEPADGADLRDRGLLSYHLNDYPSALQDLERYLRIRAWEARDKDEHTRIVEHIQALRHRVASFN